ncbi:MAG: prepilin-type cleavage/methylation domain-containing protein [Comamonadaceae bacterium CG_4_9_14_0_8_um_filter_57_21]|nr:MAG: prepilin-type cleavage/methylation domain-containing protein [Comamonadaceae bacterium CG_4_9_14_0_8_um_filter_57_21]
MKQAQRGFTLIELVMVIVILGVLAAVALPKFVDLKGDAQAAALQGVVGTINSASAINYAARSANSAKGTATIGLTCTTAAEAILQDGKMPTGYTTTTISLVAGNNVCTVTQTDGAATSDANILGL